MVKPFIIIASVVALLVASCDSNTADNRNKLERMKWLIGKWQMETPDGIRCELWQKESDTTYTGVSYLITNNDSLILEYMDIKLAGNELYYIPIVIGHNDNKPISFKLTQMGKESFIFENPEHDFPQTIGYRNFAKDSLYAWIEGKTGSKSIKKDFIFAKSK